MFTEMKRKKGKKRHGEEAVEYMYIDYTHIKAMKIMGALEPDSLTKEQKGGTLCNKHNKRKSMCKSKGRGM